MTTAYNKFGTGTRVGNWVEEQALKDLSGVHRVTTVGDRKLDTTQRVLAHSAAVVSSGVHVPRRATL
jgi:hypothetical protein